MRYIVLALAVIGLLAVLLSFGGTAVKSSPVAATTPPPATVTPTDVPQYRPVSVVAAVGPMTPINPGGPTVKITLQNDGPEAVVALSAVLKLNRDYQFDFPVAADSPLAPGATITQAQTLINGGISADTDYQLEITATTRSGSILDYAVTVRIASPNLE